MSDTIHKFHMKFGSNTIDIPSNAEPLAFQLQDHMMMLWVKLDPSRGTCRRSFKVYGIGSEVPQGASYIGTLQFDDATVWHLFET
jgi:hypothetical protein